MWPGLSLSWLMACAAGDTGKYHPSQLPALVAADIPGLGRTIDACCSWACVGLTTAMPCGTLNNWVSNWTLQLVMIAPIAGTWWEMAACNSYTLLNAVSANFRCNEWLDHQHSTSLCSLVGDDFQSMQHLCPSQCFSVNSCFVMQQLNAAMNLMFAITFDNWLSCPWQL